MFCDMKNSAHTWLKEGEFFINFSKYYIFFYLQVHTIMINIIPSNYIDGTIVLDNSYFGYYTKGYGDNL